MSRTRQLDRTGLEVLDSHECLRLLKTVPVGRLVFTDAGLPAIRLVNFFVDGDTLVFTTAPGDKLRAAERGDVVAFEVDAIDLDRHLGWTVTAIGHLSVVPEDEKVEIQRLVPLHSWAPHRGEYLVRLGLENLTGRRLLAWAQRHAG
jgi:uncharacterized protein